MANEKACKKCNLISSRTSTCPRCKTHTLSDNFMSMVIILDPEHSQVAEKLKIKEPGKYALKVR
ncbi:MAG: transcription elongation factor subunit Spt4 [Promethearchaeota archaeon]